MEGVKRKHVGIARRKRRVLNSTYALGQGLARLHGAQTRVTNLDRNDLSAGRNSIALGACGIVRRHNRRHVSSCAEKTLLVNGHLVCIQRLKPWLPALVYTNMKKLKLAGGN